MAFSLDNAVRKRFKLLVVNYLYYPLFFIYAASLLRENLGAKVVESFLKR